MLVLLSKLVGLFLALWLAPIFLSSVGDMEQYVTYSWSGDFLDVITNSTQTIYFLSNVTGGGYLTNALFSAFAAVGVLYPLSKIKSNNIPWEIILICYFPSVLTWTSPVGKEAPVVLGLGLILGWGLSIISAQRSSAVALFSGLFLVTLFKPHYLVPLLIGWTLYLCSSFDHRVISLRQALVLSVLLVIVIVTALLNWTQLDTLFFSLETHFSPDSSTTRQSIWNETGDFIYSIPYGVYLAFIAVTPHELLQQNWRAPLLISFCESVLLIFIFIHLLSRDKWGKGRQMWFVGLVIVLLFWFVHHPFGALNSGSAMRYRSGFLPFLVTLLYGLSFYSRDGGFINKSGFLKVDLSQVIKK